MVRRAFILYSLELKVSNANFDRFDLYKQLCVLCVLLCRPSGAAVCLSLVMSGLQIMLVFSCCKAHQYIWLLSA